MALSKLQSLVLVTAIVLSSLADKSFPRVGNAKAVTAAAWCVKLPSSRFDGFSTTAREERDGIAFAGMVVRGGGWAEMW